MKVFSVYDVQAAAYCRLIEAPTAGLAARSFVDACQDPRSPLAQHPQDYWLHEIAEWDPATGRIESYTHPKPVISAAAAVAKREPVQAAADNEVLSKVVTDAPKEFTDAAKLNAELGAEVAA